MQSTTAQGHEGTSLLFYYFWGVGLEITARCNFIFLTECKDRFFSPPPKKKNKSKKQTNPTEHYPWTDDICLPSQEIRRMLWKPKVQASCIQPTSHILFKTHFNIIFQFMTRSSLPASWLKFCKYLSGVIHSLILLDLIIEITFGEDTHFPYFVIIICLLCRKYSPQQTPLIHILRLGWESKYH